MCRRVSRISTFVYTYTSYRPAPRIPTTAYTPRNLRNTPKSAHAPRHLNQSSTGLVTVGILVAITIGGALLIPLTKSASSNRNQPRDTSEVSKTSASTFITLEMTPKMPPGRPGTLTPEQEVKLREFWAVTLRVFGVYEEPTAEEPNGATTPRASTTEPPETGGKKDKRKSRLHMFRKGKDKGTDSDSVSGTSTPSDLSQLSLADGEDKHGETKDFRAALASTKPDDLRKAFWSMVKHDHPDGLLLRFLRARKWDIEKALIMMISTMHWRAGEIHVDDDIIRRGEAAMLEQSKSDDPKLRKEGQDFLDQMRMGKSYLHGVDKEGRPICVVRVRFHRQGEQSEQSLERFTVYTIETARMLLRPPVDTATVIFDMTDFSMANMDYTPVKFMIKCFEANYPESLGAVLVHKSPWIFQGIWSIIRGWLDPVVAGKVHFTKNPDELEAFIPRKQIPKELGGDEDWSYKYVEADPAENAIQANIEPRDQLLAARSEIVRKYEGTILDWIRSAGKESADEKASSESVRVQRDALAEDLKKNYWELDPYLRARSYYDRTGVIQAGGVLDFYPSKEPPKAESAKPVLNKVETSPDDLD
ncbi:CRAL/TRIO domain-containing protein [Mytilinidion resinicola]|uniref:CRAL/TRIO domain-containing protein n=1 Tax=Mytilinidion resinicola TaxID=574789 RepID=A0A6A6YZ73_9PEZI|nr:CRAL/TRIO domain-containing protein [Mytilinidion resinicola]KAF2813743.1 CRAL/TRIO domain-containing protein [Mytilinidion resinicola]